MHNIPTKTKEQLLSRIDELQAEIDVIRAQNRHLYGQLKALLRQSPPVVETEGDVIDRLINVRD